MEFQLKRRGIELLEGKRHPLISIPQDAVPRRPVALNAIEKGPLEHVVDICINLKPVVSPSRENSARLQNTDNLWPELRVLEPVQCLSNRDEIDRSTIKGRLLCHTRRVDDPFVWYRVRDLVLTHVCGVNYGEVLGQTDRGLPVSRRTVPSDALRRRQTSDVAQQFVGVAGPGRSIKVRFVVEEGVVVHRGSLPMKPTRVRRCCDALVTQMRLHCMLRQ